MKIKNIIVITWLSLYIISCKPTTLADVETTGTATLVFRAMQEEMSVHIYKPIDDTYNFAYITDKFDLKPNIRINYELEVNGFAFVKCIFSNGTRGAYFVFPGDCVEITCEPQGNTISGSNAEGHTYFHDNFIKKGLGHYEISLYSLITIPVNYDSLYNYFLQEQIAPFQAELKQMELSGSITPGFSSVMDRNLYFGISDCLLSVYYYTFLGKHPDKFIRDNFTPSEEDVQQVLLQLNRLLETPYIISDDVKKMPYFFCKPYLIQYYYMDDDAKEKLTEGYDNDIFGDKQYLLLASDSLQLKNYGTNLISDLQSIRSSYDFNQEKMLAYLNNKFPDSEYVAIIKKLMAQTKSAETNDEVVVMNNSPSSIREMMQLPGIKGKYAYIDLWSTSCPPCIYEFNHNPEVHQLLSQYNNIVPVYISIDTEREIWENGVRQFDLKGFHIMVSDSLNEEIGMKIFHENKIGFIPRYILLDPDGNVVNDNLPRKSNITELRPIFAGLQN